MKNKKRVLKYLLIAIVVVAIILFIVLVFGILKDKQVNEYQEYLEDAACKYAEDENYSEILCDAYKSLCKVSVTTLLNKEYISKDVDNPLTRKNVSEDDSYINISWSEGEMVCTYKEG